MCAVYYGFYSAQDLIEVQTSTGGFSYEGSRWSNNGTVKSKKKPMNIEHPTLNVQHRILYSIVLKIYLSKANLPFENIRFAFFKID